MLEGVGSSAPCIGISGAGSWRGSVHIVLLSDVKCDPSLEQVNKTFGHLHTAAASALLAPIGPHGGSPPLLFGCSRGPPVPHSPGQCLEVGLSVSWEVFRQLCSPWGAHWLGLRDCVMVMLICSSQASTSLLSMYNAQWTEHES